MATQDEVQSLLGGVASAGITQCTNIELEGLKKVKKAKTPLTFQELQKIYETGGVIPEDKQLPDLTYDQAKMLPAGLATGVAMTSQMDVIKETAGFGTGAGGTDGGSGDGKDQSDSEIDDDVEFNCPEGYQYSSSTKSCIPIDTSDRRENNQATTAFLNQVTNSHKVFLRDLTSNPDWDGSFEWIKNNKKTGGKNFASKNFSFLYDDQILEDVFNSNSEFYAGYEPSYSGAMGEFGIPEDKPEPVKTGNVSSAELQGLTASNEEFDTLQPSEFGLPNTTLTGSGGMMEDYYNQQPNLGDFQSEQKKMTMPSSSENIQPASLSQKPSVENLAQQQAQQAAIAQQQEDNRKAEAEANREKQRAIDRGQEAGKGYRGGYGFQEGGEVQGMMPMPQQPMQQEAPPAQLPMPSGQPAGFIQDPNAAPAPATPEEAMQGEGREDDVKGKLPEGTFVINAMAVQLAGIDRLNSMVEKAYKTLAETMREKNVDEPLVKQLLTRSQEMSGVQVDVAVSNGEYIVPPEIVPIIGEDKLRKINERGLRKLEEKETPEPEQQMKDGGSVQKLSRGGFVELQDGGFPSTISSGFIYEDKRGNTIATKDTRDALERGEDVKRIFMGQPPVQTKQRRTEPIDKRGPEDKGEPTTTTSTKRVQSSFIPTENVVSQEPSERKDIGLIDAKKPVQNQILKGSEGMMKEYYEELDKQQTSPEEFSELQVSEFGIGDTQKKVNQPKSTEGSLNAAQRSSQQILFLQQEMDKNQALLNETITLKNLLEEKKKLEAELPKATVKDNLLLRLNEIKDALSLTYDNYAAQAKELIPSPGFIDKLSPEVQAFLNKTKYELQEAYGDIAPEDLGNPPSVKFEPIKSLMKSVKNSKLMKAIENHKNLTQQKAQAHADKYNELERQARLVDPTITAPDGPEKVYEPTKTFSRTETRKRKPLAFLPDAIDFGFGEYTDYLLDKIVPLKKGVDVISLPDGTAFPVDMAGKVIPGFINKMKDMISPDIDYGIQGQGEYMLPIISYLRNSQPNRYPTIDEARQAWQEYYAENVTPVVPEGTTQRQFRDFSPQEPVTKKKINPAGVGVRRSKDMSSAELQGLTASNEEFNNLTGKSFSNIPNEVEAVYNEATQKYTFLPKGSSYTLGELNKPTSLSGDERFDSIPKDSFVTQPAQQPTDNQEPLLEGQEEFNDYYSDYKDLFNLSKAEQPSKLSFIPTALADTASASTLYDPDYIIMPNEKIRPDKNLNVGKFISLVISLGRAENTSRDKYATSYNNTAGGFFQLSYQFFAPQELLDEIAPDIKQKEFRKIPNVRRAESKEEFYSLTYQRRMAMAILQDYLIDFKGDPVKAIVAYNAGYDRAKYLGPTNDFNDFKQKTYQDKLNQFKRLGVSNPEVKAKQASEIITRDAVRLVNLLFPSMQVGKDLKTQLKGQESAIQLPVSKPKKMTNGGFV